MCTEFRLMPPSAEPGLETSTRDVVDGDTRLGEDSRIAERGAEHQTADARLGGDRRQRAERRDCLEVRRFATVRRRFVEMVPDRDPVDDIVEPLPQLDHVGHRSILLAEMDPELQSGALGHEIPPSSSPARVIRCINRRWPW